MLQQLGLFLDIRTTPIITCMHQDSKCYTIIQCKSMINIECKYNSMLILGAGQLGTLVKYTSRLEGNKLVSNQTNLIHTSKKYCCKYNLVVLSSFGQTNQLTKGQHLFGKGQKRVVRMGPTAYFLVSNSCLQKNVYLAKKF